MMDDQNTGMTPNPADDQGVPAADPAAPEAPAAPEGMPGGGEGDETTPAA